MRFTVGIANTCKTGDKYRGGAASKVETWRVPCSLG